MQGMESSLKYSARVQRAAQYCLHKKINKDKFVCVKEWNTLLSQLTLVELIGIRKAKQKMSLTTFFIFVNSQYPFSSD